MFFSLSCGIYRLDYNANKQDTNDSISTFLYAKRIKQCKTKLPTLFLGWLFHPVLLTRFNLASSKCWVRCQAEIDYQFLVSNVVWLDCLKIARYNGSNQSFSRKWNIVTDRKRRIHSVWLRMKKQTFSTPINGLNRRIVRADSLDFSFSSESRIQWLDIFKL